MNYPYFGATIVNQTFTQTLGTRRELVDWIAGQLITAGWSYVSGSGTGTPKLRSAATPHGLRCKMDMSDVADATVVRYRALTDDELFTGGNHWLFPGVGLDWRIIASPYYFWLSRNNGTMTRQDCAYLVNLYIPAPFRSSVTEAFFSGSNSQSSNPGNTGTTLTLRNGLSHNGADQLGLHAFNGTRYQPLGGTQFGALMITAPAAAPGVTAGFATDVNAPGREWFDGSRSMYDAPVNWGPTQTNSLPCATRGVLPDAGIWTGPLAWGTVLTIDGHQWMAWNNNLLYTLMLMVS
jgi:hypothetical protein